MPPDNHNDSIAWDTTDDSPSRDAALIDEALDAFNRDAADLDSVRALGGFARLPDGSLLGGAIGRTWGQCCELRQIWVKEEYRRKGIGRRLVQLAEEEARRRGCSVLYLETFSFQAPELYERAGFQIACQFSGFPNGIIKYVMQKTLAPVS
jgi:GNAT superfamily N-acetyltransferase